METRRNSTNTVQQYVLDVLDSTERAAFSAVEPPAWTGRAIRSGIRLHEYIDILIDALRQQQAAHADVLKLRADKEFKVAALGLSVQADPKTDDEILAVSKTKAEVNAAEADAVRSSKTLKHKIQELLVAIGAVLSNKDAYNYTRDARDLTAPMPSAHNLQALVECFFEEQETGTTTELVRRAVKLAEQMRHETAEIIEYARQVTETVEKARDFYPQALQKAEDQVADLEKRAAAAENAAVTANKQLNQLRKEFITLGSTAQQAKGTRGLRKRDSENAAKQVAQLEKALEEATQKQAAFDAQAAEAAERAKLDGYETRLLAEIDRIQREAARDVAMRDALQQEDSGERHDEILQTIARVDAELKATSTQILAARADIKHIETIYAGGPQIPAEVQAQAEALKEQVAALTAEYKEKEKEKVALTKLRDTVDPEKYAVAVRTRVANIDRKIAADEAALREIQNALPEIERRRQTVFADVADVQKALAGRVDDLTAQLDAARAELAVLSVEEPPAEIDQNKLVDLALLRNESLQEARSWKQLADELRGELNAKTRERDRLQATVTNLAYERRFLHTPESLAELNATYARLVAEPVIKSRRDAEYISLEILGRPTRRGAEVVKRVKATRATGAAPALKIDDFFVLIDLLVRKLTPTFLRLVGVDSADTDASTLEHLPQINRETDFAPIEQEASGIAMRLQPFIIDPGANLALNSFVNIAISVQNGLMWRTQARAELANGANAMVTNARALAAQNRTVPQRIRGQLKTKLESIVSDLTDVGGLNILTTAAYKEQQAQQEQVAIETGTKIARKDRGEAVCKVFTKAVLPLLLYAARDTLTTDPALKRQTSRLTITYKKTLENSESPWTAYNTIVEITQSELLTKTLPDADNSVLLSLFNRAFTQTKGLIEAAWCLRRTYKDPATWKDPVQVESKQLLNITIPAVLKLYANPALNDIIKQFETADTIRPADILAVATALSAGGADARIWHVARAIAESIENRAMVWRTVFNTVEKTLRALFTELAASTPVSQTTLTQLENQFERGLTVSPLQRLACQPTVQEAANRFGVNEQYAQREYFDNALNRARTQYDDKMRDTAGKALEAVVEYLNELPETYAERSALAFSLRADVSKLASLGIDSDTKVRANRARSSRRPR